MIEYDTYYFGDNNEIEIILLKYPQEDGIFGMVNSKLLKDEMVGIHISTEEESITIASLYISSHNNQPMIAISQEVFNACKGLSSLLSTIVFHELGHYFYEHYKNISHNDRIIAIKKQKIDKKETDADSFAVKYLGREVVIEGLRQIKNIASNLDVDAEDLEIHNKEIDLRIAFLNNLI